jgi:hypothetical protein
MKIKHLGSHSLANIRKQHYRYSITIHKRNSKMLMAVM